MSCFSLKILAALTMLIDHTGAILFPHALLCRYIGRISFPIYCFLLVEGFRHTSSKKNYALRLFLFALISEVPFDLAFRGQLLDFKKQNIFFTLFLGLFAIWGCEIARKVHLFLCVPVVGAACFLAWLIKSDYHYFGILLIFCFYWFTGQQRILKFTGFILLNTLFSYLQSSIQYTAALAVVPLAFYNGKRGRASLKYFFYLFYPAHWAILYGIKRLL